MDIQWISVNDPRWSAHLLEVAHDVYHRLEYVEAEASLASAEPIAVLIRDDDRSFFLPLVLRNVPDSSTPLRDAISPNGYPGPLVTSQSSSQFCRETFAAEATKLLLESMRERNIVSCFIRFHPFFTHGIPGMGMHGELVEQGSTVHIDLRQSDEDLWRQTRYSHRSEIKRCQDSGFETMIDSTWSHLDEFIEIYYQTMRRVSADPDYFFPRRYFETLRDRLRDHVFLCVTRLGGRVASGGIFTKCHGIVQYHLGATATSFTQHHPSKLLLDFARRWAKENGFRTMHLGGGVNCRVDALLNFKLGFSKLRTNFVTCRIIADERAYARLVTNWESDHQSIADDTNGYFPAYRKPASGLHFVRPDGPPAPNEQRQLAQLSRQRRVAA